MTPVRRFASRGGTAQHKADQADPEHVCRHRPGGAGGLLQRDGDERGEPAAEGIRERDTAVAVLRLEQLGEERGLRAV